jgi:predicted  nucleic acid-binding Zn-ribbon protein
MDEFDKINAEIDRINADLGNNYEIIEAEKLRVNALSALHHNQTMIKETEEILKAGKIKLDQSNASLYGGLVKNPKELQDLEREISNLTRQITEKENTLMSLMEQNENLDEAFHSKESTLVGVKSTVAKKKHGLSKSLVDLDGRRKTIEHQISSLKEKLIPSDLELYTTLSKSKHRKAVVLIVELSCDACGGAITAAEWQRARSGTELLLCQSCGRILYAS